MSRRLINTLLFLFLSTIVVNAQTQFNPHTQINWPYVTGNGAPSASCSSKNYGEPYTDILSSPNVHYTCGAYGWFVSSGSGGSGGPVAPANTVFNITGDSRNLVSGACASGASIQGPITASTVSGGILTASMTNVLAAGNIITLADFTGGYTALNGQQVTVLSTGLSSTQFEAAVTGVSNGTSGTGSSACTFLASTLLKYSPVIPSSSSVINTAVPNQTVYNMNTNYTSLYHSTSPAVTGEASYLIIQDVGDFISSGGIANVASVESNLQSLWQKAHTDGYLILQESIIPHSCSIYDLNCAADIATVNGWLRHQTLGTGVNGQYWDRFDDIAQLLNDYTDAGFFLQTINAGHLTDSGNNWHVASWIQTLTGGGYPLYPTVGAVNFGQLSGGTNSGAAMVVGGGASLSYSGTGIVNASSLDGVAITGTPSTGQALVSTSSTTGNWQTIGVCGSGNIPCTNTSNQFTGQQTLVPANATSTAQILKATTTPLTPAFVQAANNTVPSNVKFSFANTTAGNAIVGGTIICGYGSAGFSVSDTQGNTYNYYQGPQYGNLGPYPCFTFIFWAVNITGGADVVTTNGTITGYAVGAEFSGVATVSPSDGTAGIGGYSFSSPMTVGPITTTQADLIAEFTPYGIGNPYTGTFTLGSYYGAQTSLYYQVESSAGSYGDTWTGANGSNYGFAMVALKAGSGSVAQSAPLAENESALGTVLSGISAQGDWYDVPVLYANLPVSPVAGQHAVISDASSTPTWHSNASGTGTASSSTTYAVVYTGAHWVYQ